MVKIFKQLIASLIFVASATGCSPAGEAKNSLSVNLKTVNVSVDGGTYYISIQTNAADWKIQNTADWLSLSRTEGTASGNTSVTLSVDTRTLEQRSTTLIVTAGNAEPFEVTVTQSSSDHLYLITPDASSLTFLAAGESQKVKIVSDAPAFDVTTDAEWIQVDKTTGAAGTTNITITIDENPGNDARGGNLTLAADGAATVAVTISQKAPLYPHYNTNPITPDATGMDSDAPTLAAKIKLGWNIGNTMEAMGGETAWGNPKVTSDLIALVKANGFNAIRIPCSWNQYMANSATAELKAEWLNRVKEVVQYCVDNDMYVLLNIHWDGGWLENNCTTDKQEANNAKQKAFWEQIATTMRDFDEHVLFASANEPNVDNATQMAVLKSYHQTFIKAVRATGGRNSYRVLVIQGPGTDIGKTKDLMTSLPVDQIEKRMMVEIHYYTPWNFCGMTKDETWGSMFYYWGANYHSTTDVTRNASWGEESDVNANLDIMKTKFVDKGIPVVMGEFSATRRLTLTGGDLALHLASRAYFLKYVVQQAKARGILPFYWDNGGTGNDASGLFDRTNNTVADQQALDGLVQGAN